MSFKNLKNNLKAFQTAASTYVVEIVNLYFHNSMCIFILNKLKEVSGFLIFFPPLTQNALSFNTASFLKIG